MQRFYIETMGRIALNVPPYPAKKTIRRVFRRIEEHLDRDQACWVAFLLCDASMQPLIHAVCKGDPTYLAVSELLEMAEPAGRVFQALTVIEPLNLDCVPLPPGFLREEGVSW